MEIFEIDEIAPLNNLDDLDVNGLDLSDLEFNVRRNLRVSKRHSVLRHIYDPDEIFEVYNQRSGLISVDTGKAGLFCDPIYEKAGSFILETGVLADDETEYEAIILDLKSRYKSTGEFTPRSQILAVELSSHFGINKLVYSREKRLFLWDYWKREEIKSE
jgi:hypothetical protein